MRSLKFWMKVTRPLQVIATSLGTWIVALLSNGPMWLTTPKVAAAGSMGLCCLGASMFHYGAARRMYARKHWDLVEVRRPEVLVGFGLMAMLAAVTLSWLFLPPICVAVSAFNLVAIVLYARVLSRAWLTKNVVIGLVCTTPALIGWLSGHRMDPTLPYFIGVIFCAYMAREIIKDIHDLEANDGIRVTLPMKFGIKQAAIIGALFAFMASSLVLLTYFNESVRSQLAQTGLVASHIVLLFAGCALATRCWKIQPHRLITSAVWFLMLAALIHRIADRT